MIPQPTSIALTARLVGALMLAGTIGLGAWAGIIWLAAQIVLGRM